MWYTSISYLWVPLSPLDSRAEVTHLLAYSWVSLRNHTQIVIPWISNKISETAIFLLSWFLKIEAYFFSSSYDLPIRHMHQVFSTEGIVQPNESDPSPICCFWRTNIALKIYKEQFSLFLSRSKIPLVLFFKG